MPLFEYTCSKCDHSCELLMGPGETPVCPRCGSKRLEKLMSVTAGHVRSEPSLPVSPGCPPPEAGPCSPNCCRLPQ